MTAASNKNCSFTGVNKSKIIQDSLQTATQKGNKMVANQHRYDTDKFKELLFPLFKIPWATSVLECVPSPGFAQRNHIYESYDNAARGK